MIHEQNPPIRGQCYCGGVQFEVAGNANPQLRVYCHCKDCRQAHAAPVYQADYIPKQQFLICKGSELLQWYTREESRRSWFKRYFCMRCGGRVFNDLIRKNAEGVEQEFAGVFPSLFNNQELAVGEPWAPNRHVYCKEAILDVSCIMDGLEKGL